MASYIRLKFDFIIEPSSSLTIIKLLDTPHSKRHMFQHRNSNQRTKIPSKDKHSIQGHTFKAMKLENMLTKEIEFNSQVQEKEEEKRKKKEVKNGV